MHVVCHGSTKTLEMLTLPNRLSYHPLESKKNGSRNTTYIAWLKIRGLDATGSAEELRERVAGYVRKGETPAIIKERQRPVEDVEHLVTSLHMLLGLIMATTVTQASVMKTRYAVRVFLSAYDTLYMSLVKLDPGQPKPDNNLFRTYNFACLINLPDMMEQFGPLRNIWEGATRGEGFLRFVKPFMTQGFKHSNWHYHLLEKLFQAKGFDNILPQEVKNISPLTAREALRDRRRHFQLSKSLHAFKRDFGATHWSKKTPISVILVESSIGSVDIKAVVDSYDKNRRCG